MTIDCYVHVLKRKGDVVICLYQLSVVLPTHTHFIRIHHLSMRYTLNKRSVINCQSNNSVYIPITLSQIGDEKGFFRYFGGGNS